MPPLGYVRTVVTREKEEMPLPLYMDHHKNLEGLTAEAVAEGHKKDLEAQDKYGVKFHRYWYNE